MDDFIGKQASQIQPKGEAPSTESLDAMSPAQLAAALEELLDSMTEENYDPALIDAYLDALDRKAPMPEMPDTGASFREFQRRVGEISFPNVATQDRGDNSPGKPGKRPAPRALVTIAATVAIVLALMVGAQAAGMDIFGNLARWTDELFFIGSSLEENPHNAEYQAAFQEALEEQGFPKELAPAWYPVGFTSRDLESWNVKVGKAVEFSFENKDKKIFFISVESPSGEVNSALSPFEKDATPTEIYTSGQKTFYIMSNVNITLAVWSEGDLLESIKGNLSVDEVKAIIDSIGG